MDKQKKYKKNYGIPFFAMAFLAAAVFEFYYIMTEPYSEFMLIGIGIIMLITGYLTIDSILTAKAESDAKKEEQNDMMLKAQKAIYIATKKNAKDAEIRQAKSIKAVELMMNKMITTQQALLEEKKTDGDDMTSLIDQLSESNAKLAKEVQSAITVNQLVKANADLVRNVKEALSANASSTSSNMSEDLNAYVTAAMETPMVTAAPKATVAPTVQNTPVVPEPVVVPEPAVVPEPVVVPEPIVVPEPVVVSEPIVEATPIVEDIIITDEEPFVEPEPIVVPDDNLGFDLNEFDISAMLDNLEANDNTMTDIENEINLAQMAESEELENITVPDEMTPELDAAMDDGSDIIIDTITTESNPFASKVDDSPNRQLTEEEIAALFASL